jgi:hypothetical protein
MILDDENVLIEDLKTTIKWPSLIEHHFNNNGAYSSFGAYANSLTQLIRHLNNTCKIADGTWYATRSNKIIFAYDFDGDELLQFEYIRSHVGDCLEVKLFTRGDLLKRYNINDENLQNIVDLLAAQPGYKIVSKDPHRILYSKFC